MSQFAAGSSFFKGPKRMKMICVSPELPRNERKQYFTCFVYSTFQEKKKVFCSSANQPFVILQRTLIYVTDIPLRLVTTLPGVHSNLQVALFLSPSEGPDSEG